MGINPVTPFRVGIAHVILGCLVSGPPHDSQQREFEETKTFEKIVKTSQRIERNLGLRFESCDFKSLRIGAIRSAANCAPRIGTSKKGTLPPQQSQANVLFVNEEAMLFLVESCLAVFARSVRKNLSP